MEIKAARGNCTVLSLKWLWVQEKKLPASQIFHLELLNDKQITKTVMANLDKMNVWPIAETNKDAWLSIYQ